MADTIPQLVPPLPRAVNLNRNLPVAEAWKWLAAGAGDLAVKPLPSLLYGLGLFLLSAFNVVALFLTGLDYLLFPVLAGFLIIAPVIATGLYEKSRRVAAGRHFSFADMVFVRAESGGQILFTGVLLAMVLLVWVRAAVIVYALFFGMVGFPGLDRLAPMLFTTPLGWAMLVVGSLIGGLFAAFAFAVSVFSIPMLLNERLDAFTAMGTSMALVWNNLPVMLMWGVIVLSLLLLALVPGMLGLIIVFPVLGHATWHAYLAVRQP